MSLQELEVLPRVISVDVPNPEAAELELDERASQDENKCIGYYPSLNDRPDIQTDLEACSLFSEQLPVIEIDGLKLGFNFLRRSLIRQEGESPFHLDNDSDTSVTGDPSTLDQRVVWRLLLNLSANLPRKFAYLDVDPSTLPLGVDQGYIHCPDDAIDPQVVVDITLPPRTERSASGVLFCSNLVLHTGQDEEGGHFVAGYGQDVPIA